MTDQEIKAPARGAVTAAPTTEEPMPMTILTPAARAAIITSVANPSLRSGRYDDESERRLRSLIEMHIEEAVAEAIKASKSGEPVAVAHNAFLESSPPATGAAYAFTADGWVRVKSPPPA